MIMKRAFLVHGWQGKPLQGFRPWLKQELERNGFAVEIPEMPNTDHPKMNEWISHLAKRVGAPDEDCYFLGHSLGSIAILRYLENLEHNQKIGGAAMVAGFTDDLGIDELSDFFQTPIEWDKIRSHCNKFVAINSDNDPYVNIEYGHIFEKELDAKLIMEEGKGHFSSAEGTLQLPSALNAILEMAK